MLAKRAAIRLNLRQALPSSVESSSEYSSTSGGQSSSISESADNQDIHESSDTSDTSSSQPTTSKPTGDNTSSSSGGNTSSGKAPYGGYYDASGNLHCQKANVPKDADGYSVISYTDEYGVSHMTKAEKEAYDAEIKRINEGGKVDLSDIDWSQW